MSWRASAPATLAFTSKPRKSRQSSASHRSVTACLVVGGLANRNCRNVPGVEGLVGPSGSDPPSAFGKGDKSSVFGDKGSELLSLMSSATVLRALPKTIVIFIVRQRRLPVPTAPVFFSHGFCFVLRANLAAFTYCCANLSMHDRKPAAEAAALNFCRGTVSNFASMALRSSGHRPSTKAKNTLRSRIMTLQGVEAMRRYPKANACCWGSATVISPRQEPAS
mmetsp:Transcript_62987/g.135252  ORF Transcript_62987/g.135252 Transcript_62987/m.135252 type:complete len:222 (-) Transcript_62987:2091-2756(-)